MLKFLRFHVYVVVANKKEKVKECKVFFRYKKADNEFKRLQGIYSDASVYKASRYIT